MKVIDVFNEQTLFRYSDVAHLIQENSAKMHIRRERVKNHPKLPKTFNELRNILVNYGPAQTIYQGQVVISKTCSAVIFASNAVLERMNDSQELYVDGTFKVNFRYPQICIIRRIYLFSI